MYACMVRLLCMHARSLFNGKYLTVIILRLHVCRVRMQGLPCMEQDTHSMHERHSCLNARTYICVHTEASVHSWAATCQEDTSRTSSTSCRCSLRMCFSHCTASPHCPYVAVGGARPAYMMTHTHTHMSVHPNSRRHEAHAWHPASR